MKPRTPLFILFLLLPSLLPAQSFDFNAARSAEQLRLGVQAFHRGLYNNAWAALEKAISYQPSNILAQVWLGRTQWKSGYEQEAARTWQQVVASGKASALVREWISTLSYRRGIGRDLKSGSTWAVSSVLDGTSKSGYPFRRPTSVRARADGTFWVVAFGSNEVLRFDANFRVLDSFKGGLAGFDHPYDIAELPDGSFFVSEYGANRIARCSPRGDKVSTFGSRGRADGMFLGPQYMTLDSRGYLWVTDWGNSRVMRFDTNGTFIQSITGINGPTGIAAHEDLLYVTEKAGKRVLVYDLNGNPITTIGEGTLTDPEGLSFTPSGKLLVADANRVLECDLGQETWTVRVDTSSSTKRLVEQVVTPNGNILGVDFDQSLVVLLTDAATLYAGLVVRVDRVNSVQFPTVYADVSVETRAGTPVLGLELANFIVTENRGAVKAATIAQTNTAVKSFDVALVVERSPEIDAHADDLRQAVADLYAQATQGGRISAVSAAGTPTREADFGETRLRFIRQSLQAPPTARWRFDLAARMAGDDLITAISGARRALVFLSSGSIPTQGFSTYSLLELAAYMRNNGIAFYPVIVGSTSPDESLTYLAAETGGTVSNVASPGGMKDVVRDIRARVGSVYTIQYTSASLPEFGERYIPLEIEVTVQRVSGRDEAGYYAPPTTGAGEKRSPGGGSHTPAGGGE